MGKIKDFLSATALALTDFMPLGQGDNTRKTTIQEFKNFILTDVNTQLSERVKQTTADITYYVDATNGNDSNNGTTSGTAFKTIGKAIGMLPQAINHAIAINIASGTYNEDVVIDGFIGKGVISLTGGNSSTFDNYKINSITVSNENIPAINISGLRLMSTSKACLTITKCKYVNVQACKIVESSASDAISVSIASTALIGSTTISNRGAAINSQYGSIVISNNNTGTGNTYGLAVYYNSTIGKNGTQPSGTTAEYSFSGGVIR